MTPLDRRLLGLARAAVAYLLLTVVLGLVAAALAIAQARLLADAISAAFLRGAGLEAIGPTLAFLGLVLAGRAATAWTQEASAHRAAAAVKARLRAAILERGVQLEARRASQHSSGEIVALATRGVDALDAYYARYLPQVPLAAIIPVAVVVAIAGADLVAAVTVGLTVPLIVVFMVLIGRAVEGHRRRRWQALTRLAHHFLDVVQGLPTLKVFGRAKAQVASLERVTDAYRIETMASLRIAFLSAFALEFFATLSVALVAVGIGIRLVEGSLDLRTGLFVLVLAPEAYLPLRQLGLHFHASEEGRGAIRSAFELIDTPLPAAGTRTDVPDLRTMRLRVDGVAVRQPDRDLLAPGGASFTIEPGEIVAITGANGAGKSTLLTAILGLVPLERGAILLVGSNGVTTSVAEFDPRRWRRQLAWVPQVPFLAAGTLADNIRLTAPAATDVDIRDALDAVGLYRFELAHAPRRGRARPVERGTAPPRRRPSARARSGPPPRRRADGGPRRRDRAGRAGGDRGPRPAARFDGRPRCPPARRHRDRGPGGAAHGPGLRRVARTDGRRMIREVLRLGRTVRGRLALSLLAGIGAAGSAVALTGTSAWLISRAAEQPPILYLMVAIVAVRAFGVSRGALRYAERLPAHDASLRILAAVRSRTYRRLDRLAPAGLADQRSGDLLSRLVADVDSLVDLWPRVVLPIAIASVVCAGTVLVVTALVPLAGVALAATLLVAAVGAPLAGWVVARRAEASIAPARGALSAAALDLLQAAPGARRGGRRRSRAVAPGHAVVGASARRGPVGDRRRGWRPRRVVVERRRGLAGARRRHRGRPGRCDRRCGPGRDRPAPDRDARAGGRPGAGRAADHPAPQRGRSPRRRPRPAGPDRRPTEPAALPAGPFGLRIRDLHARYAGTWPEVLDGVHLELGAGERALITGPSGSGKSTLAAVLLRFLDPSGGTVELIARSGPVDIRSLAADDVRRVVGLCAQDAHLFNSTIAENVRLARPGASDDELRRALGRAHLLEWIDTLPDGLDTFVGEAGARLSGGQRQRLELARSILADRPILVFDEPTEHLDEATAAALTEDLLAAAAGRTAIFITHRPELHGGCGAAGHARSGSWAFGGQRGSAAFRVTGQLVEHPAHATARLGLRLAFGILRARPARPDTRR